MKPGDKVVPKIGAFPRAIGSIYNPRPGAVGVIVMKIWGWVRVSYPVQFGSSTATQAIWHRSIEMERYE